MIELLKRSITGAVFVAVTLICVILSPWSLFMLLLAISGIALFEFYKMFGLRGYTPFVTGGIISGAFILLVIILVNQAVIPSKFLAVVMVPVILFWFSYLFARRSDLTGSVIITMSGLIYIILPLALIPYLTCNALTSFNYNPGILIGILCLIWTYDTGAYLTGITLGKHKMAPAISPKKSWEGLFGGLVLAVAVAVMIAKYSRLLDLPDWIILSIIVVIAGTAGDLFESIIKREAGVKDSGSVMPGHGGILDRFDSVLMIIPFVFLYLYLFRI